MLSLNDDGWRRAGIFSLGQTDHGRQIPNLKSQITNKSQLPNSKSQTKGLARSLVLGAWNLVLGIWCLGFGACFLVVGSQFASGRGRDLAIGAGAATGAVVGSNVGC
jgi:Glycine zipper 2TM domain